MARLILLTLLVQLLAATVHCQYPLPPGGRDDSRPTWTYPRSPRPANANIPVEDKTFGLSGSFQSEAFSNDDWWEGDPLTRATDYGKNGVYQLRLKPNKLPPGAYSFKCTVDFKWDHNYGEFSSYKNGGDVKFQVRTGSEPITLMYDRTDNGVGSTTDSTTNCEDGDLRCDTVTCTTESTGLVPILVSDFMEAAGYGTNDDSKNLAGWMKRVMVFENAFQTVLHVPKGSWTYGITMYSKPSCFVRYGGTPFKIPLVVHDPAGRDVVFAYNEDFSTVFDSVNGMIRPMGSPLLSWSKEADRPGYSMQYARPPSNTVITEQIDVFFAGQRFGGWSANDPNFQATGPDSNNIYKKALTNLKRLTEDNEVIVYEYKVTIDGSWSVNYGAGATPDGGNVIIPTQSSDFDVDLLFDRWHNYVFSSKHRIPLVVGSWFGDIPYDDPLCGSMKDFKSDGVYSTSLWVSPGSHTFTIQIQNDGNPANAPTVINFGGLNTPFKLTNDHTEDVVVIFMYDDNTKTVTTSLSGTVRQLPNEQTNWGLPRAVAADVKLVTYPSNTEIATTSVGGGQALVATHTFTTDTGYRIKVGSEYIGFGGSPYPIDASGQVTVAYHPRFNRITDSVRGEISTLKIAKFPKLPNSLAARPFTPSTVPASVQFTNDGSPLASGSQIENSGVFFADVSPTIDTTYAIKVVTTGVGAGTYGAYGVLGGDGYECFVTAGSSVQFLFDSHSNYIGCDKKFVPILVSDLFPIGGVWFADNIRGWMQEWGNGVYTKKLTLDAGSWKFSVGIYRDALAQTRGVGAPIIRSTLPHTIELSEQTEVTFVFDETSWILGDSINNIASTQCDRPCLNGGQCVVDSCECPVTHVGAMCEIETNYAAPANCGQFGDCPCAGSFVGRFCTIPGTQPGGAGDNNNHRAPIAGGSSMEMNLGQITEAWTLPPERPASLRPFQVELIGDLGFRGSSWNDYWVCKEQGGVAADPLKHLRTIEAWVYFPASGAPDTQFGNIDIFSICNFEYSVTYNGHGDFRLALSFGKTLGIRSQLVITDEGQRVGAGRSQWYRGEPDTWHHLALVLDYAGTANDKIAISFFVDGALQYQSPTELSSRDALTSNVPGSGWCEVAATKTDDFAIGRRKNELNDAFSPVVKHWTRPIIDEFRLWTISRQQYDIQDTMFRSLNDAELNMRQTIGSIIPACAIYLPFNNLDRKHGTVGQRGAHWAPIVNQARIVEAVDPFDQPQGAILRFYSEHQKSTFTTHSGPVYEPSGAPMSGWEHEEEMLENNVLEFQLPGVVVERPIRVSNCDGNPADFADCVAQFPAQLGVPVYGGVDLQYSKHIPINYLADRSKIKSKITAITFNSDYSGTLKVKKTGLDVTLNTELDMGSDDILVFTPAPNTHSKQAPLWLNLDEFLDAFVTITYEIIDKRVAEFGLSNDVESDPNTLAIRVRERQQPIVGAPGNALRCSGGQASRFTPQWAVADMNIDLNEPITVEAWFLGIQLSTDFLYTSFGLGGKVFSVGGGRESEQGIHPEFEFFHNLDTLSTANVFASDVEWGHIGGGNPFYQWTHIAVTAGASYDAGNTRKRSVKVYINGKLVADEDKNYAQSSWDSTNVRGFFVCGGLGAGKRGDNSEPSSWEGFVDDIRVWNKVRTVEEIEGNMFQELDTSNNDIMKDLRGYWTFNDISTEYAKDYSGKGNDLVFGNCDADLVVDTRQRETCRDRVRASSINKVIAPSNLRPSSGRPSIASPVRVYNPASTADVTPVKGELEYTLQGFLPRLFNCTVPEGIYRTQLEAPQCAVSDATLGTGAFYEITAVPQTEQHKLKTVGNIEIGLNGAVPISEGFIKVTGPTSGQRGGRDQDSFKYRLVERTDQGVVVTSPERTVSIGLTCNVGAFLDSNNNCQTCPQGTYLQPSYESKCCSLDAPHAGCHRCPLGTSPSIATDAEGRTTGELVCTCRQTQVRYPSIPRSMLDIVRVDCYVCIEESDYSATLGSCDSDTHIRAITFNRTNRECPEHDPPTLNTVKCSHVEFGSTVGSVAVSMSLIGFVICFTFFMWIVIYRNHMVIRHSQPIFSGLFCLGAAFLNLSGLLLLGDNTDITCALRPWALNLSFTMMFSALFVKVWRVWRLFSNYKLKKLRITDFKLGILMGQVMIVEIINLGIWFATFPVKAVAVPVEAQVQAFRENDFTQNICKSETDIFYTIAIVYKVVILFFGVKLSWETRKVDGRFAEAKYIALAIFYMFTLGGVCFFISTLFGLDSFAQVTVQIWGITLCTTVAVALVFFPKVLVQAKFLRANRSDFETSSDGQGYNTTNEIAATARGGRNEPTYLLPHSTTSGQTVRNAAGGNGSFKTNQSSTLASRSGTQRKSLCARIFCCGSSKEESLLGASQATIGSNATHQPYLATAPAGEQEEPRPLAALASAGSPTNRAPSGDDPVGDTRTRGRSRHNGGSDTRSSRQSHKHRGRKPSDNKSRKPSNIRKESRSTSPVPKEVQDRLDTVI